MSRVLRFAVIAVATVLAACAVRLGGPSPVEYDVAALAEPRNADADAVAERIRGSGADIVLLVGERTDSAWYQYVAYRAGLGLSGPGTTTGRGYAFLANLELLGDTSLVLDVPGGGSVHMHDALYQIDETRFLDLMTVRLLGPDLRAAVRTLLDYIATDVMATAPLLLVFDGPTPQRADSAAVMVRATIANALECVDAGVAGETPLRMMYGPSARVRCLGAQPIPGETPGIVARLQIGRW